VEVLLGVRMPRRPRLGPSEGGIWQRVLYWLKDRRTWTAMLYMLLQLPLGIVYFTVSVTGLATGLGLISAPLVQLATGHSYVTFGNSEYMYSWWQMPLLVVGGALLTLVTLNLIRLAGRAHAAYAKAMLVRAGQRTADAAAAPLPTGGAVV
jgi:Putative sensor